MPTFLAPLCRPDQLTFNTQEQMRYASLMNARKKEHESSIQCWEDIQFAFFFDMLPDTSDLPARKTPK
jgi:hypothetical protein